MLPPSWAFPSSHAPTPELLPHQGFASSATVALVFFVLGVLVRFFRKIGGADGESERASESSLSFSCISHCLLLRAPSFAIPVRAASAPVSTLSRGAESGASAMSRRRREGGAFARENDKISV